LGESRIDDHWHLADLCSFFFCDYGVEKVRHREPAVGSVEGMRKTYTTSTGILGRHNRKAMWEFAPPWSASRLHILHSTKQAF
jgi:hypothetical protein